MRRFVRRLTRRDPVASVFEPALRPLVRAFPRRSLALDCGANVGLVSEALARIGFDVVAFEPHPQAFEQLATRFARRSNVTCVQKAVSIGAGRARLHLHAGWEVDPVAVSQASSLYAGKRNVLGDSWVDVETIDLDAYIAGLDRPVALVKVDVEGAEVDILERLLDTGRIAEIGLVLVEMHDGKIPELSQRGAILRDRLASGAYAHVHLDWR